jgi:hypothetical protein
MTRIRATLALALVLAAVAAPTAFADTPVGEDQLSIRCPYFEAPASSATPVVPVAVPPDHSAWVDAAGLAGVVVLSGGMLIAMAVRRRAPATP